MYNKLRDLGLCMAIAACAGGIYISSRPLVREMTRNNIPYQIHKIDVNRDGYPDLVMRNANVGLLVYLNDGKNEYNRFEDITLKQKTLIEDTIPEEKITISLTDLIK